MRYGAFIGGLYILNDGPNGYSQLRDAGMIGTDDAPWPPAGMDLYQYTSVADSKGNRYHGFHGKLVSRTGTQLSIQLRGVGDFLPAISVDISNPLQCNASPPSAAMSGATALVNATKPGTEGAIFLALPYAVSVGAPGTKLPIGQGD